MGRGRGGLTTKIHAVVDALGRPIRLMPIVGQVHDTHGARELLVDLDVGRRRGWTLRDEAYFGRVFVESGALTWPNGFDYDPIALHDQMSQAGELRPAGAAAE